MSEGLPSEPTTDHYRNLRYDETVTGSFGEAVAYDSWMPTCPGMDGKLPYAKYHDHPALDYYDSDNDEQRHPQYSWSDPSNWDSFAVVDRQVRMDPELVGRAFIMQREDDPYTFSNEPKADPFLFGDGDNVIDKDGEPISEYVAAIELLAGGEPTFQEVSVSVTGAHGMFRGRLPDGTMTQYIQLREEPLDGYTDPPMLELYQGPKVAVLTGNQVAGTPEQYATINMDGLRQLMSVGTAAHPNVLASAAERSSDCEKAADGQSTSSKASIDPDYIAPGLSVIPDAGPEDAPNDLPKCYERALTARYTDEKVANIGNHGVNLYAALLGVWAGYDTEECVDHFATFAPNGDATQFAAGYTKNEIDRTQTKVDNGMQAPSISALRRHGLFDAEETCDADCPIHAEDTPEYVALLPKLYRPKTRWGDLEAQTGGRDAPGHENPDAPTIDEVQQGTQARIGRAMHYGQSLLVGGIMGSGKTYSSHAAVYDLNEPLLYTAPRKDLYGQAQNYAKEVGFDEDEILTLPTPEDCPTFRGDYGEEWQRRVWNLYELGGSASVIHTLLADELPCCADEDEHPEALSCNYRRKNQYDPDHFKVIIGHYKHAHLHHVTLDRAVVFDEAPGSTFLTELRGEVLVRAVNAFLSLHHSPPIGGWDELLQARHDPERAKEALDWFDTAENGEPFDLTKPDERNVIQQEGDGYHGYGPHAVYAILASESVPDADGLYTSPEDDQTDDYEFELAQLPGYRHKALVFASNGEFGHSDGLGHYVQIQTPPDLEAARSVIALDGTPMLDTWTIGEDDPQPAEWEQALGRHLDYHRILSDDERAAFLRDTMGHTYIQTTEHVRPYSSGNWNDKQRDAALLAAFSDRYLHGSPIDVTITGKRVKQEYKDDGFEDRGLTNEIVHSGEVRGSDAYAECESGAILGSSHHGDHEIARRAAWLGARVKPGHSGGDRRYGPTGDAILNQMREQNTAQVALRIGRGKDGTGALVAIHTAAFPDWLPVVNRNNPGEVHPWSARECAVATATSEQTRELATEPGDGGQLTFRTDELGKKVTRAMSPRRVRQILNKFANRGLLRKEADPEDGRRNLWVDTGLSDFTTERAASVQLPPVELRRRNENNGNSPNETTIREISVLSDSDCSFNGPLVASRKPIVDEMFGGEELDPPPAASG